MMRSSRPDPPKNPAGSVYRHSSEVDDGVSQLPEEVYKRTSRGRLAAAKGTDTGSSRRLTTSSLSSLPPPPPPSSGGAGNISAASSVSGHSGGDDTVAAGAPYSSMRSVATLLHTAVTLGGRGRAGMDQTCGRVRVAGVWCGWRVVWLACGGNSSCVAWSCIVCKSLLRDVFRQLGCWRSCVPLTMVCVAAGLSGEPHTGRGESKSPDADAWRTDPTPQTL